ncbi:hypothetical protein HMPREF9946_01540 [Acetobacteraceae bacterium AT-5844]|nr:hypothetical protein HMPREF9946_01540 [Acetobacteraceae bacterium AT-5844]
MPPSQPDNFTADLPYSATGSDYNAQAFVVRSILAKVQNATLVMVQSVESADGPMGRVKVVPLVKQQAADGTVIDHGTIHDVPYLRIQGGAAALILDPQPGDIGIALFASRDISTVKKTQAAAAPGSFRQNSMADALYLGGLLNGEPQTLIRLSGDGVNVTTPGVITFSGNNVSLDAVGNLLAKGQVVAFAGSTASVALTTHRHPGNNTPPTPGT